MGPASVDYTDEDDALAAVLDDEEYEFDDMALPDEGLSLEGPLKLIVCMTLMQVHAARSACYGLYSNAMCCSDW